MDWYRGLDVTEKILSSVLALVGLIGAAFAAWRWLRPRLTSSHIEAIRRVLNVIKRAGRPILVIGAIAWLGIWIQGNLLIQPLHPLSNWTLRQYALAIALVVPLALLVYILIVELWRRAKRAEKTLDLLMGKQEVSLSLDRFKTIDLPSYQPEKYYGCSCAPTGLIIVYQTPFRLVPIYKNKKLVGHRVIDIMPGTSNVATVERVSADVRDVSKVHLLLSAGNAWISHGVQGERIGYLELGFTDGSKQRVDLILGKHIREWSFGDRTEEKVNDIDDSITKPAWVSHGNTHRIDAMPISVDGGPKDLVMVRIVAELEKHLEKAVPPPSIIISAITCETSPSLLHRSRWQGRG